ncbi:DMT family transporter [Nocardia callitridis]|uniref:DMT family transporter n=1 Tax=Nocardia callitridis TaxID=648753 RepID=A0ABP9K3Z0_9NOCA
MTTDLSPAETTPPTPVRKAIDLPSAIAAVITVILWASAFVAIRDVGTTLSPAPMALLRLAVAGVALSVVVLVKTKGKPRIPRARTPLVLIATYAVLWLAGYTVALNVAELHVDAGTAALLVTLAPLLVAFAAGIIFREGITRMLIVGGLVSLLGVATMTIGVEGHRSGFGVLMCLLAAVLYAAGVLVQKAALRHVDGLTAIWLGCLVGVVALSPWAPQLIGELSTAPARTLFDGIYLGLFPTALGFTAWSFALRRTDASRLAASTYAVPAVSVVLSWVLLGETPTGWALLGGAFCLAGVAISRARGKTATK